MRFVADENFPRRAVALLRQRGAEVVWIRETAPAAKDHEFISRCLELGGVLLTFDKDFGELARRVKPTEGFGVLLFRVSLGGASEVSDSLVQIIEQRSD